MLRFVSPVLAALILFTGASVFAQEKATSPFYGNATCPVTGKDIDRAHFASKQGERIYVADKASIAKVDGDWAKHYEKAYPKANQVDVKNVKCPMMPRKKGKDRFVVEFQGYKLRLCCKKCKRNFKKQPNKWLTLALNKDLVLVKNAKCFINEGKKVAADSFMIVGKHLIGTCCADCLSTFNKDPKKYGALVKKALEKKPGGADEKKGDPKPVRG